MLRAMTDLPPYDLLMVQARAAAAEVRAAEPAPAPTPPNLRTRNAVIIGTSAAVLAAYGFSSWWDQGFTRRFRTQREGGFGRDTEFLGIDKLGHAYATYVGVRTLVPFFESVGNPPEDARRLAALSTWGTLTAVEILDGFSRQYRFSHEDFIANTVGTVMGYALAANPGWDDLIDFRLQYRPSPLSGWDPPGDYAGQRYWLIAKAEGIQALRNVPVLRYLEVGVGYGAPGVDTPDEYALHDFAQRRREVFWGVSLNLSRVLADAFYGGQRSTTRTQRLAEYAFDIVQLPTIYYRGRHIDR